MNFMFAQLIGNFANSSTFALATLAFARCKSIAKVMRSVHSCSLFSRRFGAFHKPGADYIGSS